MKARFTFVRPIFGAGVSATSVRLFAAALLGAGSAGTAAYAQSTPDCAVQLQGAMLVSADCEDPAFNERTFIIDKTTEVAAPLPHTRVEAHFEPRDGQPQFQVTLYLPPRAGWQGRFFQHAYPLEQPENLADIEFALRHGGYLVNVKGVPCGCGGYRPDAAAAKLARQYARKFYGVSSHIYGYLWGGSGGGLLTVGAAENTQGVWDGIAPYVMPNAGSLLNINAVGALANLALRDRLAALSEAVKPGSRQDPMATLDPEQRAIFAEALGLGIPERTFESAAGDPSGGGALLMFLSGGVKSEDPGYVDDFWSKPGYEGANPPAYLSAAKRDEMLAITAVNRDAAGTVTSITLDKAADLGPIGPLGPIAFELWLYAPDGKTRLGEIAGRISGNTITVQGPPKPIVAGQLGSELQGAAASATSVGIAGMGPGYKVRVNNLFNLALHYYHRHAIPTERDMYAYDQFRNADGSPRFPQRKFLASSAQAISTAGGAAQTGNIRTRVIVNQSMLDGGAAPWMADWYAKRVRLTLGPKRYAENFRLYFNDNAVHMDSAVRGEQAARIVTYVPALYQSILDLSAWVERGVAPPQSSAYTIEKSQVRLAPTAAQRHGLQPVVALTVAGSDRGEVPVGQPVTFDGLIETPPGSGKVSSVKWWFGDTPFALEPDDIPAPSPRLKMTRTHIFARPGTYFVTLWAASTRDPASAHPDRAIENLARVRVVVR